ncbi:acyltransferase [Priestia megaterium]|uniref:acyltransferase n=1 Tax=Priestia megaterium TaxID=1404 RepID=UPI00366E9813
MRKLIIKIKKQNPKKVLVMGYNVFRMGVLKLFHPQTSKISLIQNIHPSTEIARSGGSLELSNSIFTRRNVSFRVESGNLKIGTSFFNQGCSITAMKNIVIGDNCLFGPNVVIVDHDHDYKHTNELRGNHYLLGDVIIGNNVWVGSNVTIMRGTVVGSGAVIGAGSVIKGNIPENTVVYSNRKTISRTINE